MLRGWFAFKQYNYSNAEACGDTVRPADLHLNSSTVIIQDRKHYPGPRQGSDHPVVVTLAHLASDMLVRFGVVSELRLDGVPLESATEPDGNNA